MFSRSVVRAASKVATASKAPLFRASFSSATTLKREVIAEREVPVSTYTDGSVKRSTIIVGDDVAEAEKKVEKVTPLSRTVYNSMPPTMQKMSVFGKVVIVTGYVLIPFS